MLSVILLISMIGCIVLTVGFEYRANKRFLSKDYVKRNVSNISF